MFAHRIRLVRASRESDCDETARVDANLQRTCATTAFLGFEPDRRGVSLAWRKRHRETGHDYTEESTAGRDGCHDDRLRTGVDDFDRPAGLLGQTDRSKGDLGRIDVQDGRARTRRRYLSDGLRNAGNDRFNNWLRLVG